MFSAVSWVGYVARVMIYDIPTFITQATIDYFVLHCQDLTTPTYLSRAKKGYDRN